MLQLLIVIALLSYILMTKRKPPSSHNAQHSNAPVRRSQRHRAASADEELANRLQASEKRLANSGSATTRPQTNRKSRQSGLEKTISCSDEEFPVLRRLELYASDILGDGNCLFRAMSDQFYGDGGKSHVQVRAQVVGYMKEHSDYFQAFVGNENETFTRYLRRMSQDGVFGDNIEIVAFANSFHANVVIYQRESMYVVSSDKDPASAREVNIAYHDYEHYSTVRNKDGPHTGMPNVRPRETPLAKQHGDSAVAPDWKIKLVRGSLPDPLADDTIKEWLIKYNGDIGSTVEKLLMEGIEEDATREDIDQRDAKRPALQENDKAPKNKPKNKLTAQEKKARQKQAALERKRQKRDTNNSTSSSLAAAAAGNSQNASSFNINNSADDGIRTTFI